MGRDWYGYGGIGDYMDSHGNTPQVIAHAHAIRDGYFTDLPQNIVETDEIYDALIVGGGMAGLGAAYHFWENAGSSGKCLMLDNHPVLGGEAKQNEFRVQGQRLIGPQGANGFSIPDFTNEAQDFAGSDAYWYRRLGVPEHFEYPEWPEDLKPLSFGGDHYGFIHWLQPDISIGRFYRTKQGPHLVANPMRDDFQNAPIPEHIKKSSNTFLRTGPKTAPVDVNRWLDGITYQQYMEGVLGLDHAVTEYINPIVASAVGLGADVVSAYTCMNVALPGFKGISNFSVGERHSFPGGNAGFARYFLKKLIPAAIKGDDTFDDIIANGLNKSAFDRRENKIRIRLAATVIRMEHLTGGLVSVLYIRDDKIYRVKASRVVMASGGWINKHIVQDLPQSHYKAYDSFTHAPMLVANVALNNWRFMYKAGITGCLYDGDFGFECNIRKPMMTQSYQPPLHPDMPTILTFYVPFPTLGMNVREQAVKARNDMLMTSYADYEYKIRTQLTELFEPYEFDAKKDIAGIILNRWGHAYVVPEPGFFFGRDGQPAARDVVMEPFGKVAFGHSELRGNQHWGPAALEGKCAMSQLL